MLTRRRFVLGGQAILAASALCSRSLAQEYFGKFIGEFEARFNPDGRTVTLLSDLAFIDPDDLRWTAPKGIVVDGASIPWPLWSIVGSPYTGGYRRASVIHDQYCDTKQQGWQETHYVFYRACRVDGVSSLFAKLLYGAVLRFGPRWEKNRNTGETIKTTPDLSPQEFDKLKDWILKDDPSVRDINKRVLEG
jgi:hypothetical protein